MAGTEITRGQILEGGMRGHTYYKISADPPVWVFKTDFQVAAGELSRSQVYSMMPGKVSLATYSRAMLADHQQGKSCAELKPSGCAVLGQQLTRSP